MRTYIPEDKREYEKMYEATTGKVSHKILIELEPEVEKELRTIAEHNGVSLSEAARGIVSRQCRMIKGYRDLREQIKNGEVSYVAGEQK